MPKIIEENGKKKQIFDPSNPDDMKIASELAKKQLEKLGWDKGQQTEAEAETKLQEAEEGQKLFNEMRSKVSSWYTEKGLSAPKIDSKDSLTSAVKNLEQIEKLEQNQQPYREPTGSAPLSPEQIAGRSKLEGEYGSTEEMINDLRSKAHSGDKTAQLILDRLLEKTLKGVKTERRGIPEYVPSQNDESEIQRLNRNFREKRIRERIERSGY